MTTTTMEENVQFISFEKTQLGLAFLTSFGFVEVMVYDFEAFEVGPKFSLFSIKLTCLILSCCDQSYT